MEKQSHPGLTWHFILLAQESFFAPYPLLDHSCWGERLASFSFGFLVGFRNASDSSRS